MSLSPGGWTLKKSKFHFSGEIAKPEVLDKYKVGSHIGSGCQGSVYKAERKFDNKKCVVKVMTAKED
jgi:serine/threonine protein kinase